MMSRYYMTLPSNSSMEYCPDNTLACNTTKLAPWNWKVTEKCGFGGDVVS